MQDLAVIVLVSTAAVYLAYRLFPKKRKGTAHKDGNSCNNC